ncbi:Uncharacterized phage protein [Nitrobacter hamburgensis X14]|uniref:Uncharacterized phage protein n=1 Tax=Nitrobacter hamburgensis (strain DSM 10229 / NCIMB 13809 / X14) TaxID=323097 RepID=Q1QMK8_NITHX|nr:head-tail connector protein [Nitrobacter hamburgensis]ABE62539.1 Uncharacterized phage protein [Nitrobacter hamburgensis X14]
MAFATLEELKAHCNVDFADDDAALQDYLDGASEYIRPFLVDDPEADVPPSTPSADLRQATLLIASSWYQQREASIDATLREIPFGAREIINNIRSWNFGL